MFTCADVTGHVCCFVQSDSCGVIIDKSMGILILIYNLVNQHPGDFILNH